MGKTADGKYLPKLILILTLLTAFGWNSFKTDAVCAAELVKDAELPTEIRFTVGVASITAGLLEYAVKTGLFEEEFGKDSIKISFTNYTGSGTNAVNALVANQADFAPSVGDQPTVIAAAGGIPVHPIAVYMKGNLRGKDKYMSVLAGKDSGIETINDLTGKIVAAQIGTNHHAVLLRALDAYGLPVSEIKLANMRGPDIVTALLNGSIDAGVSNQPSVAQLITEGARPLDTDKSTMTFNYNVIIVRDGFADKYPETTRRVLGVYAKAAKRSQRNKDELLEIISDYVKLDKDVTTAALRSVTYDVGLPDDAVAYFSDSQDFLFENKLIEKKADDITKLFNTRFLKELNIIDE
jgi:sulfonate transport system substrate-binding protein